jgi:hypothetical protein
VLIDGEGVVRHFQVGYGRREGIGVEGWRWSERATGGTGGGR